MTLTVTTWGCPQRCAGSEYTPPVRRTLAAPHAQCDYALTTTVGLLRYRENLILEDARAVLAAEGVAPSLATVARQGHEFLVRFALLCEKLLPPALALRPLWVLQIDGTVVRNGPVTFRAREALTGVTLLARQLVVEDLDSVVGFLRELRGLYGVPVVVVRDLSPTLKLALGEVYPGVPQQEDHFHWLQDLGPKLLVDYEPLREALLAGKALAHLAEWSRGLPLRGRALEELERVWVRLALEHIEGARAASGGFPFRLPYLVLWERATWVLARTEEMIRGNVRRGTMVIEVVELKERLRRLLSREAVGLRADRVESERGVWEGLREALRLERSRRSREPIGPMTEADVAEARARIEEVLGRFRERGDWAVAVAERVERYYRDHEGFLWSRPGLCRSTVELERAHREDRHGIRRRTGQGDTGEEMGRVGSLLAMSSNLGCPWFLESVLTGVDLLGEFARQDPGEVHRRMRALPREGRRPCVPVSAGKRQEVLQALVDLVEGASPLDLGLRSWARVVETPSG